MLADGGLEALRQFDDELIARHLSPGGRSVGGDPVFIRVSRRCAFPANHCNTAFARTVRAKAPSLAFPVVTVNTELRHNRIVFTDIVRRLS